jgi:DNA-directed RNA polymerase subunit RPC12/RpoP
MRSVPMTSDEKTEDHHCQRCGGLFVTVRSTDGVERKCVNCSRPAPSSYTPPRIDP